jgi:hypothetical protein
MTTRFKLLTRDTLLATPFTALALAVLSTVAMLGSIHSLADSDAATAAHLAAHGGAVTATPVAGHSDAARRG